MCPVFYVPSVTPIKFARIGGLEVMPMNDSMIEVEHKQTYGVLDGKRFHEVYLKLYVSFFTSGLVSALEPHRTVTLLAIASFMDRDGRCYPTQDQIAERIGVHRTTANKWIKDLLEFRWNDRPIISRAKLPRRGRNPNSVYTIHPISQLAIFDGQVEAFSHVTSSTDEGFSDVPGRTEVALDVLPTDMGTCRSATLTRTIELEPCISPIDKNYGYKRAVDKEIRIAKGVDPAVELERLRRHLHGR